MQKINVLIPKAIFSEIKPTSGILSTADLDASTNEIVGIASRFYEN